jgi:Protein of unknown function (DUF1460)
MFILQSWLPYSVAPLFIMDSNQTVKKQLAAVSTLTVEERVIYWCNQFKGKPFSFNSCGDAASAGDANSLFYINFNAFDCVSFINTLYALSHTADFNEFKKIYTGLRYINGLSFGGRNHFIEQWYYNNVVQKKYFAPLEYDIFPPDTKQTIKVNVVYSQWIQLRLKKTMEEITGNPAFNLYELKYNLTGYSLAAIFSAAKKSGQKAELFLEENSYISRLQTGDVLIFISGVMMHLAVVTKDKQLEVFTASSVKNEVTKFGLVYYLQLLHTMRTATHIAIIRDAGFQLKQPQ